MEAVVNPKVAALKAALLAGTTKSAEEATAIMTKAAEDRAKRIAQTSKPDAAAIAAARAAKDEADKREYWRDLFERRYLVLKDALPWIPQYVKLSLDAYKAETPAQKEALEACTRFCEKFLDRKLSGKGARGLLFVGNCGTGKTHMAMGILEYFQKERMPGFFLPSTELFDLYSPDATADLKVPFWKLRELLTGVSVLVLDDVGTDSWTTNRRARIQQLIDMCVANELPTIITSNASRDDMEAAGERLISRFSSLYPIVCEWADYRRKHSLARLSVKEAF